MNALFRALFACVLAVAPAAVLVLAAWHSQAVRDHVATLDLAIPYLLMAASGAAILWQIRLALGGGAEREREAAPGDAPRTALVAGAIAALFVLPALHLWTEAIGIYWSVAGLVPYSDAGAYYQGAERLLFEGSLDDWNSRRPLTSLFLAARLALTGNDLRLAILLQAALAGFAIGLLVREVARDRGAVAGITLLAALLFVGREYVRYVGSESLGLTLGALAATLLWCGASDRRLPVVAFGLAMMTIALNARAGAFLTLPFLVLWAAVAFRGERRFAWRAVAAGIGAVAVGFVINSAALRWNGGQVGAQNGNFALTLYGLSTGHPGWLRYYQDFPGSEHLPEPELFRAAYARAWENIRTRPEGLLRGLLTGADWWRVSFVRYLAVIFAVVPWDSALNAAFQLLLLAGVARWLWIARREPSAWLVIAAALGLFLSEPVVFPDGEFRVTVVSYPLLFLVAALGAASWRPRGARPDPPPGRARPGMAMAAGLSCAIVVAALAGPSIAHRMSGRALVAPILPPPGHDVIVARLESGLPRLDVLAPGSSAPSFVPRVRDEDLARALASWPQHLDGASPSGRLTGPVSVRLVYDLQRGKGGIYWVISRSALPEDDGRPLALVGRTRVVGDHRYFDVDGAVPLEPARLVSAPGGG